LKGWFAWLNGANARNAIKKDCGNLTAEIIVTDVELLNPGLIYGCGFWQGCGGIKRLQVIW